MKKEFTTTILKWLKNNPRELAWKEDKDAYSTWLSEIIMQQTRVEYGTKYYLKFKQLFPTIFDLANAPQENVMKAWEGLGYYSRARNLHFTAKMVANEMNGEFPATSKELQKLKGVGPYTASAIASFVYNEPIAAIDGNAYRVLSRYFGIATPIDSSTGKKEFQALGNELISLHKKEAGNFNQAIMNFGALVCTPKQANCNTCKLNNSCVAYSNEKVCQYPVKEKKIKQTKRYFTFFVIHQNDYTYIEERTTKDVWKNLWQFPLIETTQQNTELALKQFGNTILENEQFTIQQIHSPLKQQLSHQTIYATFIKVALNTNYQIKSYQKVKKVQLKNYPFPKIVNDFLKIM